MEMLKKDWDIKLGTPDNKTRKTLHILLIFIFYFLSFK